MELSARARIRAGDPVAFGDLFDEHAQVVYRYAVRVTGDWASAEDIVSLTFLEAWRLRAKIRSEGESLRPWLLGIATNVLRNASRAARRHEAALSRMPGRDVVPDFSDELVGRLADAEELAAARTALDRLRKAEREVFTLCVWAGLNYAEAAEALGVPVGTVRSRLSRARTRLRELTDAEREPSPGGGQHISEDRANAVRSKQERHP
ncbi:MULTISPECIES: RNA polymerase sigma factor [Actinomadura]|uniref:RNA polymerase sigma factor n=1 Tax=Actinomadura yumaensis TaxID=111807 RepID=A0ABW2CI09_9ACTN|nr:RNA polymerase sigma factor [Actinomadura sp. J1-007]MWK34743.1 sigma-70 family RNA polymerase sigma factor [Actinomadura sp. J1-007]